MDELITAKDVEYYIGHYWTFVAVGFVVYLGGLAVRRLWALKVPPRTPEASQPWSYRVWLATESAHPFLVGGTIGLLACLFSVSGFETPFFVARTALAQTTWFAFGGVFGEWLFPIIPKLAKQLPALIVEIIRKKAGVAEAAPALPAKVEGEEPPQDHDPGAA